MERSADDLSPDPSPRRGGAPDSPFPAREGGRGIRSDLTSTTSGEPDSPFPRREGGRGVRSDLDLTSTTSGEPDSPFPTREPPRSVRGQWGGRGVRSSALATYLGQVVALVWKDLAAERRTKEILSAMLVFGLLVVLIFNFAFDLRRVELDLVGPGILWVAFTFAGVLGLNRAFALEKDRGAMEALMLAPMDRSAVYVGKLISVFILMTLMEAAVLLVYSVLNNQALRLTIVPVVLLGTLGFVAAGTVFAAISANTRTREVLLPILLFPVLVPVIITAVGATAIILRGGGWDELNNPLSLLVTYDIVFLVAGFLLFDFVLEE